MPVFTRMCATVPYIWSSFVPTCLDAADDNTVTLAESLRRLNATTRSVSLLCNSTVGKKWTTCV